MPRQSWKDLTSRGPLERSVGPEVPQAPPSTQHIPQAGPVGVSANEYQVPPILSGYKWTALSGSLQNQALAADQAAAIGAEAQRRYERDLAARQPYEKSMTTALGKLQDLVYGRTKITEDPGYQFRLEQGQRAAERSQAARRKLFSGQAGKELQRFGQGLAAQEYQNAVNRLGNLAFQQIPIDWSPQTLNAAPNMPGGGALREAARNIEQRMLEAQAAPPPMGGGEGGGGGGGAPSQPKTYATYINEQLGNAGLTVGSDAAHEWQKANQIGYGTIDPATIPYSGFPR